MPSSHFYSSSFLSALVLASVLALPGKLQFTNPVFALAQSLGEYWFFHGPMGWYLVGGACRTKVHKFDTMDKYYDFYKDESCQPVALLYFACCLWFAYFGTFALWLSFKLYSKQIDRM